MSTAYLYVSVRALHVLFATFWAGALLLLAVLTMAWGSHG